MVEAAVRGSVAGGALTPRTPAVLVAGAGYEAVHGRRPGLLHADAAATAGMEFGGCNNNKPPDRISNLNEDLPSRRRYYNARVCAQTQMHGLPSLS